jgi:hypothetical protein
MSHGPSYCDWIIVLASLRVADTRLVSTDQSVVDCCSHTFAYNIALENALSVLYYLYTT